MADPANVLAIDDIALMTGYEVRAGRRRRARTSSRSISRLTRLDDVVAVDAVEEEEDEAAEVVDLRESADDAPVIKLVNQIIAQAVERGRLRHPLRARRQRDCACASASTACSRTSTTVPRRMVAGVDQPREDHEPTSTSPSGACRRTAASGCSIDGRHVDLRVVTLPSVHGESVVMRILDKSSGVVDLDQLGMLDARARPLRAARSTQAYGAVLVTGPTGSGKSTTLYAALGEINTPEKNIITIEDPVEYQVDGHHPGAGQPEGRA